MSAAGAEARHRLPDLERRHRRRRRPRCLRPRGRLQPDRERVPGRLGRRRARRPTTSSRSSASASAPPGPRSAPTSGSPTSAPTATPPATASTPRSPTTRPRTSTWSPGRATGSPTDDEFEIFGQRVSAAGPSSATDFRISNMAPTATPPATPSSPRSPTTRRRTSTWSTWQGDGLANDDEFEIFGQRVSAAGAELGDRLPDLERRHGRRRRPRRASTPRSPTTRPRTSTWSTWLGDGLRHRRRVRDLRPGRERRGPELGLGLPDLERGHGRRRRPRRVRPPGRLQPDRQRVFRRLGGDGLVTDGEFEVFGRRVDPTLPSTPISPPPAPPTPHASDAPGPTA